MTERTPYSNANRKRRRAAEHNARYEAERNQHRAEPLFRYITRLAVPEHPVAIGAIPGRRGFNAHAVLAATLAATAGGAYDR